MAGGMSAWSDLMIRGTRQKRGQRHGQGSLRERRAVEAAANGQGRTVQSQACEHWVSSLVPFWLKITEADSGWLQDRENRFGRLSLKG